MDTTASLVHQPVATRVPRVVVAAIGAFLLTLPGAAPAARTTVLLRTRPGTVADVARAVDGLGATIVRRLDAVDELVVRVARPGLARLTRVPGVTAITANHMVRLSTVDWGPSPDGAAPTTPDTTMSSPGMNTSSPNTSTTTQDPNPSPNTPSSYNSPGSFVQTAREIGAPDYYRAGITGRGVDVALIDSGVTPVRGLDAAGKLLNGPDLSFESQAANLRHLDTFGHGTHMAGIIAGRDLQQVSGGNAFAGVAPNARLVSVKVADAGGNTDASQVIAAIDWVVQHRHDNGLNIRVLNLSFGTDSDQDPAVDPLAHAVEVAWQNGIVVVAAAGNMGNASGRLTDPGSDPFVIAVGSDDTQTTVDVSDDVVSDFSSSGDGVHDPTLLAPGRSIVSLRDPGSAIDTDHPEGRVGDRFFRGSGTSQATAVVSGAAALVVQQHPNFTPDQVKQLLASTARPLNGAPDSLQGAGLISLSRAKNAGVGDAHQWWVNSDGSGSLEGSRGGLHLVRNGNELNGERDIFGVAFDSASWAAAADAGTSWVGGVWNGSSWSGSSWSGSSWSDAAWSASSWTGEAWANFDWSASSWSGSTWSGGQWTGSSWSIKRYLKSAGWCTDSWT